MAISDEEFRNLKVGDVVEIWITAVIGDFRAKVVGFDGTGTPRPRLKVLDAPSWDPFTLKDGDYIIRKLLEKAA